MKESFLGANLKSAALRNAAVAVLWWIIFYPGFFKSAILWNTTK